MFIYKGTEVYRPSKVLNRLRENKLGNQNRTVGHKTSIKGKHRTNKNTGRNFGWFSSTNDVTFLSIKFMSDDGNILVSFVFCLVSSVSIPSLKSYLNFLTLSNYAYWSVVVYYIYIN